MTDTISEVQQQPTSVSEPAQAPSSPAPVEVPQPPLPTAPLIENATFDALLSKPRRVKEFFVTVPRADGEGTRQLRMIYRALSGEDYDALLDAHKPTPKMRSDGAIWHRDNFPPALIAAVSMVPKLTAEQARELYGNPDWSPGESGALFMSAVEVCSQGLDVPFTENG
jgi:hypothetical protein